jgi:hypothetical protein
MSDITLGQDGGILPSDAPAPQRVRHAEARRRTLVVAALNLRDLANGDVGCVVLEAVAVALMMRSPGCC